MVGEFVLGNRPERTLRNFWKKVAKGGLGDCWLWIAGQSSSGYGSFAIDRKNISAHRTSWLIHNGAIPKGLHVLHNCPTGDNKLCVNPAHLYLGTEADNGRDRSIKCQMPKGDSHPWRTKPETMRPPKGNEHWSRRKPDLVPRGERKGSAVLTESQVLQIRCLYETGAWTQRALAILFDISQGSVQGIVTRKTWRHI